MNFVKKIKHNTFLKTYIIILLPSILLMVALLTMNVLYTNNFKDILEKSHESSLYATYQENETAMKNVVSDINMLYYNKDFFDTIKTSNPTNEQLEKMSAVLNNLEHENEIVYNAFVIDKAQGCVYSDKGMVELSSFFKYTCNLEEYKEDFWIRYKAPFSPAQILAPTLCNFDGNMSKLIPIVFTQIGKEKIAKLLVVNVNVDRLLYKMDSIKFSPNTRCYLVNKNTGRIYNTSDLENRIMEDELFRKIISNERHKGDFFDEDGNKNMIIAFSPKISSLSYSYVVTIPHNDISVKLGNLIFLLVLFSLLVSCAAMFAAYNGSKSITGIFKSVAEMFSKKDYNELDNDGEKGEIVDFIRSSIRKTMYEKQELESAISTVLPLVAEKYILNLLNKNDCYIDSQTEAIAKDFVNFKHDYFMAIIIKFEPKENFYSTFTDEEYYNRIKPGIYGILKEILSDSYMTYIIPTESDTFIVLLNLPEQNDRDEIIDNLKSIIGLFNTDKDYVDIYLGAGNIYQNVVGLKRSYDEAVNLMILPFDTYSKDGSGNNEESVISFKDENNFYNYLWANYYDKAKRLVDAVFNEYKSRECDEFVLIQLAEQFFSVVSKIMRAKKINGGEAMITDLDVRNKLKKCTAKEAYDMLIDTIDRIDSYINSQHGKIDVTAMIDYINKNFCSDLSLEILAHKFGTAPKYISKLIKDKLGISFLDYVAGLRINKARELLTYTDKNIADIYEELGFNNRNTFIRTFKSFQGITPSEYRNLSRGSAGKNE